MRRLTSKTLRAALAGLALCASPLAAQPQQFDLSGLQLDDVIESETSEGMRSLRVLEITAFDSYLFEERLTAADGTVARKFIFMNAYGQTTGYTTPTGPTTNLLPHNCHGVLETCEFSPARKRDGTSPAQFSYATFTIFSYGVWVRDVYASQGVTAKIRRECYTIDDRGMVQDSITITLITETHWEARVLPESEPDANARLDFIRSICFHRPTS